MPTRLPSRLGIALLALAGALAAQQTGLADSSPAIVLRYHEEPGSVDRFEVHGLGAAQLAGLADSPGTMRKTLSVFVADASVADNVPLFGDWSVEDGRLVFRPRFSLRPGVAYRAELNISEGAKQQRLFRMPRQRARPPGEVVAVFPSAQVLPENQLKFYLHFSTPMRRGEAYGRVRLIKEGAGEVEFPFLELGEELWDPNGRRFTLFFDPGRIKRGLKPREEIGPALEEGGTYRLVIDQQWADAEGRPLKNSYTKHFRVRGPDQQQPNHQEWKLHPPAAGTNQALVVELDEPLDHGMLQRVIHVEDGKGAVLHGRVDVDDDEMRWSFTPADRWPQGRFSLVVQTNIEDLAGNSLARPFEVDLFRSVSERIIPDYVTLQFRVESRE